MVARAVGSDCVQLTQAAAAIRSETGDAEITVGNRLEVRHDRSQQPCAEPVTCLYRRALRLLPDCHVYLTGPRVIGLGKGTAAALAVAPCRDPRVLGSLPEAVAADPGFVGTSAGDILIGHRQRQAALHRALRRRENGSPDRSGRKRADLISEKQGLKSCCSWARPCRSWQCNVWGRITTLSNPPTGRFSQKT